MKVTALMCERRKLGWYENRGGRLCLGYKAVDRALTIVKGLEGEMLTSRKRDGERVEWGLETRIDDVDVSYYAREEWKVATVGTRSLGTFAGNVSCVNDGCA